MIIGFTGTRKGMTPAQALKVGEVLTNLKILHGASEFVHGCEEHSDLTAAGLADGLGMLITGRPGPTSTGTKYDAYTCPPEPFLVRNEKIVRDCEVLIACPSGKSEKRRSGTWHTVRQARKTSTPIVFVYPDGKVYQEGQA